MATINGGSGNDTLKGSTSSDQLNGDDGDDSIFGDHGNDIAAGSGGHDYIDGGTGEDTLVGGQGEDTILGGDDADTILGDGQWYDLADYASGSPAGSATKLTVTNSADGPIELWWITSNGTPVYYATIQPGQSANQSTFENHNWLLRDEDGFYLEAIEGALNQTVNYGADGLDDNIDGGTSNDDIYGQFGNDTIDGGSGHDTIEGGYGNDSIDGGHNNDRLFGGDGDDTIDGGVGADLLFGGDGNDLLNGGGSFGNDDTVFGGAGNDTISGGTGSSDDSLFGEAGNDLISGGGGSDVIEGGTGDDTLDGGAGNDMLSGGSGDDVFIYAPGDGLDTVNDFNTGTSGGLLDGDQTNNDFIDLSGYYDHISELYADQADDGVLNQSNDTDTRGHTVDYNDNTRFDTDAIPDNEGIEFTGATADDTFFTAENTGVVCFTAGTFIATASGDVRVEDLVPGDLVQTMDNGLKPLRWIGSRHLSPRELAQRPNLRPIRISSMTLGLSHLTDDLLVSPQHRILVSSKVARRMFGDTEVLVAAKRLLELEGVEIARNTATVAYYHLLFDAHEILFANGMAAESLYLGTEARKFLCPDGLEEIRTLIPEAMNEDFAPHPCRQIVLGRQAKKLCWRHTKNQKPLVEVRDLWPASLERGNDPGLRPLNSSATTTNQKPFRKLCGSQSFATLT